MSELCLIRHGQTDWNQQRRFQGQSDVPLNGTGLDQACALAESLAGQTFTALYSSDLSRAFQTASIVGMRLGLPVHIDRRLREICQGEWEGMTLDEVSAVYERNVNGSSHDPVNDRAPGGESVAEVAERMRAAADEIAQRHSHGTVLVVTHGLALATLLCAAHGIPLEQVYSQVPGNAAPVVIEWPPRAR